MQSISKELLDAMTTVNDLLMLKKHTEHLTGIVDKHGWYFPLKNNNYVHIHPTNDGKDLNCHWGMQDGKMFCNLDMLNNAPCSDILSETVETFLLLVIEMFSIEIEK